MWPPASKALLGIDSLLNENALYSRRMQTTPAAPDGSKPTMFRTLQHTVHTLGFRGIYTGLSASLMRQMSYSLVRIGSYEAMKEHLGRGIYFASL